MRAPKPIAAPAALALPLLLALAACLAFGCSDDRSGSATDATSAAPEAEARLRRRAKLIGGTSDGGLPSWMCQTGFASLPASS